MLTPGPPQALKIDPAQARMVQELKHGSPLIGCRVDPSGQFVFAGAQDNWLIRWHGEPTPIVLRAQFYPLSVAVGSEG